MTTDFAADETWDVRVTADTTQFAEQMRGAGRIGRQFSSSLITAFEGIAIKGKGLGDVFKNLALSLSKLVLKAALRPLEQGFSGLVQGLLSGATGFSSGGVLQAGTPVPFARGGVISSPMMFPLSGGRTGLAGEAGAEAIMPLARGADGRLGVVSQGGGGTSVVINVTTPDAESFRRSETQIAAMLVRATGMGQRNL